VQFGLFATELAEYPKRIPYGRLKLFNISFYFALLERSFEETEPTDFESCQCAELAKNPSRAERTVVF